jgi:hypothetical protein
MFMFMIDQRYLGAHEDLVFGEGKFRHHLVEDGTQSPGTVGSFLKILGKEITLHPPEVEAAARACGIDIDNLGLKHILRNYEFEECVEKFQREVETALAPVSDYVQYYLKNIALLNQCARLKFQAAFESVQLDAGCFANQIIYDTAPTKTGRMSVVSGPNVLTLNKDFKQQLVSRFADGKIVEVDYSALEPRTALALAGAGEFVDGDLYTSIGKHIGISERGIAKQLIISFLYGAGMSTMCRLTGLSESFLASKLKGLNKTFGKDERVADIRKQLRESGYFKNHAGRPIFPGTDKAGVLFNNYCQSTAVDVALSGFSALVGELQGKDMNAVPLCFIHDAMLLDVPAHEMQDVAGMTKSLPTYLGLDFPTKLTVVNN